ncbi:tRNA (adenosine(37)-N6)-threonylcarbamoyltransferase complex dimerization subunit type 1 TsaB [Qingshengfaniella alkalisoli]|uniref:tRNA (Adenosine(37)-N6)-threonylcarbamoyltransferase complex dimerization subunit type 1 TsaB n=1 Tax=Qingshengfaniella alkalisoli TaxID=2599296 RepID=A0A5B8I5A2_9RHOB|nr:tRNA (adenosine(37)-N6)-threonylcarbamoyltransferase complex dimerization subunit type 1 TsaB [Qingshengfaniella alkalisoli]QDY68415.1 tRNA (adenosine(37)-N6)-threonylcarbamoyltransferase complex dimerization subunit type 1 TsaB [Qingshengfaniella alkalisoli]
MASEPLILAFDTAAAHCAAALLRGDQILAHVVEPMKRGQAERLMPLLQEILASEGASFQDLAAIGVGVGPGNFTGIRVSVAAARGLSLSTGVKAIGVTGFDAAARDLPRPVLACLTAPRDQVYWQIIDDHDRSLPALTTIAAIDVPEGLACASDAAETVAAATGGTVTPPKHPLTVAIALEARDRRALPEPRPAPLYIRPADAAPSRDVPPPIIA